MTAHSYTIKWDSSSIYHCKDIATQPPLQISCHSSMYLVLIIAMYPSTEARMLHSSFYSMVVLFALRVAAVASSTVSPQISSNHRPDKTSLKLSLFNSRRTINPSHYYLPLLIWKPSLPTGKSPQQKRQGDCKKKFIGPQTMPSNHTLLKATLIITPLPHVKNVHFSSTLKVMNSVFTHNFIQYTKILNCVH